MSCIASANEVSECWSLDCKANLAGYAPKMFSPSREHFTMASQLNLDVPLPFSVHGARLSPSVFYIAGLAVAIGRLLSVTNKDIQWENITAQL